MSDTPNASRPVPVRRNADLDFATTGHARLGDAGKLLQRGRHLPARQLPKLGEIGFTGRGDEAQGQNRRLARVEAAHQHLVDFRVAFDAAHGLLDVHQGEIEVGIPVERDRRDEPPGARHLGDVSAAPDGGQHALHGLAVDALHLGRRPVAGLDRHDNGGALQVGEQVHRQLAPGKAPDERHGHGNHRDRHGSADGERGGGLECRHVSVSL